MEDKQAILEVVRKYQDAIHTQNKEDFMALWAKWAKSQLISITTLYQEAEHICQDFLIGGIQKAYATIDLIADHIEVNQISDTLAIVVFSYHTECIRRETGEPYGFPGLETQVLIKEDGQWKLVHVHYSK